MTKQEIQEIQQAIAQRGLQAILKRRVEIERPGISPDTIARAWRQESYESAPDACQLVLRVARDIKLRDDERIQREIQALESEPVPA